MAGVWKHPNSKNWTARYKGAAGKWVNRSTGVEDKEEAERVAAQWEVEAGRERAKAVGEMSPSGISDAVASAERLARSGRLDANAAREIVNRLLTASGQANFDAITHRALWNTWIDSKGGAVMNSTKKKYVSAGRHWLNYLGTKADKPLESLSKADAVAYRDNFVKEGIAATTANEAIKRLRGIYTAAVNDGFLGRNPFAGIDSLRDKDGDAGRVPFTTEDIRNLLKVAEGDWKGLILLAATSGLRLMDAARLKWKNVFVAEGVIRVKTSKTGANLVLPIHKSFSNWLKTQTTGIADAPVFVSLASKRGSGKTGLSDTFKRLMKKAGVGAGVSRRAKENSRGRTTSQKSFHSFRHFAATQLAANGVRADVAQAITGHADAQSHSGYVTPDIETMRSAVNAIRLTA